MGVEYRVRPVTRFIVTRWFGDDRSGGCAPRGEFERAEVAYEVAYALCKAEHDASGEPVNSMNFIYPKPVLPEPAVPLPAAP